VAETFQSQEQSDRRWLGDQEGDAQPDDLLMALDQIFSPPAAAQTTAAVERSKQAVAEAAGRALYYDSIEAPLVGRLYLALSSRGLFALSFGGSEAEFADRLQRTGKRSVMRDPEKVKPAADQVRSYLAGLRKTIDIPVDMSAMTDFQRQVLGAVRGVPRGRHITYGELAQRIGRPRAARAVGRALGSNPVPIVIPCHRVLAADGSLGGYSGRGGVRTKRALLQLEGAL
jgi:O-6-methylguanine DNA methyltransferase